MKAGEANQLNVTNPSQQGKPYKPVDGHGAAIEPMKKCWYDLQTYCKTVQQHSCP